MPIRNESTTFELEYPFPEERIFRYQAMQDVLSVVIDQPYSEFTISELATLIDGNQATVSKAVKLLSAVGVVKTQKVGRKQYVGINRDRLNKPDPILSIPQSDFHEPIRAFLDRLADEVEQLVGVVLFGSVARGKADRASDIDVLIIVKEDKTPARRAVQSIVRELQETKFNGNRYTFQPLVESVESARRIGERLREQFDDGITLVGSDQLTEVRKEVYTDGE
ncbi:nucleotidyltransferase domain-containing protein [Halobacteria archaeon AArc-curdl1]|uniref:Nucleotidyltransferase domain-containing protein n=1 Tax=Natronosalvus hydrolyticus TaxID=2979988 RepID=A0AAP3E7Q6_9EURY|nr:nucleotidyltransferase domain-containing protein [Halobacteria archaeon AArc-curdl1]